MGGHPGQTETENPPYQNVVRIPCFFAEPATKKIADHQRPQNRKPQREGHVDRHYRVLLRSNLVFELLDSLLKLVESVALAHGTGTASGRKSAGRWVLSPKRCRIAPRMRWDARPSP